MLDQLLEEALQRLAQDNSAIEPQQETAEDPWITKLKAIGVETGVSLSNEATRREYIYED